jgi:ribonuclease HI
MPVFYAVHKGRKTGIYKTWDECKAQVEKYENPVFKKFNNQDEAKQFLKAGFGNNKKETTFSNDKYKTYKKKQSYNNEEIQIEESPQNIFIYTDGSCIRAKKQPPKAGYGIYIPEKDIEISKPLLNQKITNNRAEMMAIIESIDYLNVEELNKKIIIFTDSQYCIYIFTGTGERYEKNDYKNEEGILVPNIDLIKKMLELKRTHNITLLKVRAHTDKEDKHSIGNSIADKLANIGAFMKNSNDDNNVCDYFDEDNCHNNQSEEVKYYKENIKKENSKNNCVKEKNNYKNNNLDNNLDDYIKNNICYDSSDEEKEISYHNKKNKVLEKNEEFRKDITMDKLFDGVPMENYADSESKYKPKKKLLNWFIKKSS